MSSTNIQPHPLDTPKGHLVPTYPSGPIRRFLTSSSYCSDPKAVLVSYGLLRRRRPQSISWGR